MIEGDKLSRKSKSFGVKLFFSYIFFTVLLIISITVIHIYLSEDLVLQKFEREVSLQSGEKKNHFNEYFKSKEDALIAIAKNEYFLQFVKDGSYKYYIDLLLLTIMEANKDYMQIRYIDKHGHEKIRFDREKHSKEPYKSNTLQNKSNRYYYKATSLLKKDSVWFSNIDLNIEHGHVEKPYKSVVRVATPLYVNKEFQGILIINIFMKDLLNSLTRSALYDIYLTDDAGYYIKHKEPRYNWSIYSNKHAIDQDFSTDIVYKIQSSKSKTLVLNERIYVQSLMLANQKINMIMVEKEASKQEVKNNNNKMIITILIVSTFMSIIFTLLFTNALQSIFQLVVKQGEQLHKLATNLDHQVQLQTLENAKKDRLLQNQSKLAELGDMIGNIAHQWRHPLTRLSLTLQNLKAFKKKEKMSDKVFYEAMENSLYQIEFMSNTIDNFKNFYRKDEKQSEFIVREAIDNVLNIIGSVLDHSSIKLTIEDKEEVTIFANKNEFSQVLMNLMINAKDQIDSNHIENPQINITITKLEDSVKIELEDNAGGVPKNIIKNIFNPYFTTKRDKGTGIGLYLSKAIIEEKLNGTLSVRNGVNGAIFTIII